MPVYRLSFFGDVGGVRGPAASIALSCSDDDHAVRMVKDYADGREMELRRAEGSLVRAWPPQKDHAPSQPVRQDLRRVKRRWSPLWRLGERRTKTA